jgi:tetratricopeptide (TPR) repeat protein
MSTEEINPKEEVDVIKPERVYGRVQYVSRPTRRATHLTKALLLIAALVLLLAGGGILLYYLSKNPVQVAGIPDELPALPTGHETKTVEVPAANRTPVPQSTNDPLKLALDKEDAEKKMTDFLTAKKELDGRGGSDWGGDLYAEMIQLGQEADTLFMERAYASASAKYAEALSTVNRLSDLSNAAMQRLLEEGRRALSEGDGERAVNRFSVALMIDPGNESAYQSLQRAKKIDTVMGLIKSGEQHEQQKKLSFALMDYREALELDPQSEKARTAFNRVKTMIVQDQFQALMSSGFTALNNEKYEAARTSFMKAQTFKPDSSEVKDALAQVDQAIRLARIETLRKEALAAEKSEDWDRALKSYLAALKIDGTLQFAIRGKEYSQEMVRIERTMDFYITKPEVLEFDQRLEAAIMLLQEASKIDPKGPRLTGQIEALDRLVEIAQTTLRITLVSDNFTNVAVYKVGRLGKFLTKELDLRPGTYTVVGSRNGYKDVRKKLVVKPGEKDLRLTLICEERI